MWKEKLEAKENYAEREYFKLPEPKAQNLSTREGTWANDHHGTAGNGWCSFNRSKHLPDLVNRYAKHRNISKNVHNNNQGADF